MHYCIYLFTESEPTEEQIEMIMEPYSEPDVPVYAPISWDWYSIGGRFYNRLETKDGVFCEGSVVRDLVNCDALCDGCYAFITPEETVAPSEIWVWDRWIKNPHFKEQFEKIIEKAKSKGLYLTVLDIHS